MTDNAQIVLRPAKAEDKNFILSIWLKGQYFGSHYWRQTPQDLYFKQYAGLITKILFTPGVEVVVACDEARPDWIVGYCVFKANELYWIYTRKDYREKGIATLMLHNQPISVVKSTTKIGQAISQKKGLIFNPF